MHTTLLAPAVALAALLACAGPVRGAEPPALAAADVAGQLDQLQALLKQLDPDAAASNGEAAIQSQLAGERVTVDRLDAAARSALEGTPALGTIQDLERRGNERAKILAAWSRTLTERAQALQRDAQKIHALRRDWRAIALGLKAQGPPALLQRVRAALGQLAILEQRTNQRLAAVLDLQSRVASEATRVDAMLRDLRGAREHIMSRLFVRDSPTLPEAWADPTGLEDLGRRITAAWHDDMTAIADYLRRRAALVPTWIVLLVASVIGARALRRRSRRWDGTGGARGPARELLEHPIALALVAWLFVTPIPYGGAPQTLVRLLGLAYIVPLLRIAGSAGVPVVLPILYGIFAFTFLAAVLPFLDGAPALARSLLALECAFGVGALFWLPRLLTRAAALPPGRVERAIEAGRRTALAALVVALVGNLLGYVRLATLLYEGTIRTAFATVIAFAIVRILEAFVQLALDSQAAEHLLVVRRRKPVIAEGARRLVRFAVAALWVAQVLRAFTLTETALGSVRAVLGAQLPIGEITLSLGDLVAFAIAVWLSFLISRLLRIVLEDEVFPRMHLGRGVPYAVATFTSYLVLLIGFFVALAAAGVAFDRLAVVAGALGVGIGFGLQNIVNNFVSGLILLVERPIQIGDVVQLGDVVGEVRRIGLRSSVLHTPEGSEMIVPNASLITERVVNWTLSDRRRRIDVSVGVAYGTDPDTVLQLLLDVARRHDAVLRDPAPAAYFTGFGDSALNFEVRIWTLDLEGRFRIRSELGVSIYHALADAGISIPFPQRDVHVRTMPSSGVASP